MAYTFGVYTVISVFGNWNYQFDFFYSVQDRIKNWTGPNGDRDRERAIFMDRRSRSGPVDRRSVGLCGTLVGFHERVLIYSISPRAHGVAWHPLGWRLNLSIGLNRSLVN